MSRTATRLAVGLSAAALALFAVPANASAPTYSPGDLVTVNGASVTAPTAGKTVALSVDRVDGSSTTLVVSTDASGKVTVGDGADAAPAKVTGGPSKCNDPAFSLINGSKWPGTYNWRFRANSTPSELTKKQATNALKESANNITTSKNGCGLADQVSATNSYKGTTTSHSDVQSSGQQCNSNPNGLNVTEFGAISGGGILAATCTYSNGSTISAASVLINSSQFDWWVSGACSGDYSVKGVMTHEYGHAFGVGHVDEANHGNLTMSTNINGTCSNFEASLGQGDVNALRNLY